MGSMATEMNTVTNRTPQLKAVESGEQKSTIVENSNTNTKSPSEAENIVTKAEIEECVGGEGNMPARRRSSFTKTEPDILTESRKLEKTNPESWHSLLSMGLVLPLHIVVGLLCLPTMVYYMIRIPILFSFWMMNFEFAEPICANPSDQIALFVLATYLPFYFAKPQFRYEGWKGFDSFWRLVDYGKTGPDYCFKFGSHAVDGEKIDKSTQYIIPIHPHGTVVTSRALWRSFDKESNPYLKYLDTNRDWRMLAASVLFKIPIMREITLWFGGIDANKKNFFKMLDNGAHVALYSGGIEEANVVDTDFARAKREKDGHSNMWPVTVRLRKGFIKVAVEKGVDVLPYFVFGELDCVDAVSLLPPAAAQWLQKNRMSSTWFIGRWNMFVPKRIPLNGCFSLPVKVGKFDPKTQKEEFDTEVDRVYVAYKNEISRVFDHFKDEMWYGDRFIEFVEDGEKKVENKA